MSNELPSHASASAIEPELPPGDGTGTKSGTDPEGLEQAPGTFVQTPDAAARAAAASVDPLYGIAVEGYEIVREVGRGAMGVVYKARHISLNRVVALKMTGDRRAGEKELIRFLAEAEAVATVEHRNVVRVYDYGQSGGRPYMALEFCPGGSLAERLHRGGALAPETAAAMVERIAAGVAAAHERGIVHRDLKPGNVLLAEDGEPKVADFGIAKRIGRDLTATHADMGTPAYMAPEQAGGKAKFVGPPADVWALGVILFECLTNTKPFTGESHKEILANAMTASPPDPHAPSADVPRDLKLIYRKCLEKTPADRYPTARELADDLARFGHGEPISVRPMSAPARAARWARRNPVVAGLMAMVLLVTLGLIGSLYALYRGEVAQTTSEREKKEQAEQLAAVTADRQQTERLKKEAELRAARADAEKAKAESDARHAATEAAQANVLAELLNELFRSSDPLARFFGGAVPGVSSIAATESLAVTFGPPLQNAAARIRATLTDPSAELVRAKLLASIGNTEKNLGLFTDAKDALTEALALRRKNLPETHPDVCQSELDLGRLEGDLGDLLPAIERFRKVLAIQKAAGADEQTILTTRFYEGCALGLAHLNEAAPILRDVLKESRRLRGPAHKDTLMATGALLAWIINKQNWQEANSLFNEFRKGIQAQPDAQIRDLMEPVLHCQEMIAAANAALATGLSSGTPRGAVAEIKRAIARIERHLPPDSVFLSIIRFEMAKLLISPGDVREADELFERVCADVKKTVGLTHPVALTLLDIYSRRLIASGRIDRARVLYEEFEAANRQKFRADNPWLTIILLNRAHFELLQRDNDKALACAREATDLIKRGRFVASTANIGILFDAARLLGNSALADHRNAARELFVALRPIVVATHGAKSTEMAVFLIAEGRQLLNLNDRAGATAAFEQARGLLPSLPNLPPLERSQVYYFCGYRDLERARWADAESNFRKALKQFQEIRNPNTVDRNELTASLAVALSLMGRNKEAVPLFEEGIRSSLPMKPIAPEWDRAFGDMRVAENHLAGGDRDTYLNALRKMLRQYAGGRNADALNRDTLARLAWACGLSPSPDCWNPVAFDRVFSKNISPVDPVSQPWAYRGLALVRLRAGNFPGIEDALARVGPAKPVDHIIRGLAAASRDDFLSARSHLAKAEALVEAEKPSEKNPFPYAGVAWNQLLEQAILLAELRAALAPPTASAPRDK